MPNVTARNSYDEVPYLSAPRPHSHPDNLATIARLHGLEAPPVERCRVLELGCASGGNLIPMAYGLPACQFVGLDASARQVADGQAIIEALRLDNVTLRHQDILQAGSDLGEFDYIIAYGVYSWVPRPVQDKILALCRRHLAPNGVAYISYNVYPGWRMRGLLRDLMFYYAQQFDDVSERPARARFVLDLMAQVVPEVLGRLPGDKIYAEALELGWERVQEYTDSYLLHEYLEDVNEPVYFSAFVEHASQHGLQYLSEAPPRFYEMWAGNPRSAEVFKTLRDISRNVVDLEQYLDFLQNRAFRQTLLCHQDVAVDRSMNVGLLDRLHVASPVLPDSPEPDLHSPAVEKFRGIPDRKGNYAAFSTGHPLTKAALLYLSTIWPRAVPFSGLVATAAGGLGFAPDSEQQAQAEMKSVANNLLACYSQMLVHLHLRPPEFMPDVSERPVASPVARLQARDSLEVTNMRHETITLDDAVSYHLLRRLDGSRDRAALVEEIERLAGDGRLAEQPPGEFIAPMPQPGEAAEAVDKNLLRLARGALLVG